MAPSSPQAFMDIIPQRLHATVWAVYMAISSQLGIVCSRQMLDVKTVRLFFRARLCLCTSELLWEIRCSLEVTCNSCFLSKSFPGTLSNELPASWSIPVFPLWLHLENLPSRLSSFPIIKKEAGSWWRGRWVTTDRVLKKCVNIFRKHSWPAETELG